MSVLLSLVLVLTARIPALFAEGTPEAPPTPGIVEGMGTHFAVSDSEWLNVTLESSAPIHLHLTSSPKIILMHLDNLPGPTTSTMTLGGLEANTTYWRYDDNAHSGVQITADASGNYTFEQDLTADHAVRIQAGHSTYYIYNDGGSGTGGQCTQIGTWDPPSKTCTLTQDVNDSIYLYSSGVTLDGAGHTVTVPSWNMLQLNGDHLTVKNITIQAPPGAPTGYGFYLNWVSNSTIEDVSVSNTAYGLLFINSSNNTIRNSDFSGIGNGFYFDSSDFNTVSDSSFLEKSSYNGVAFYAYNSNNNMVRDNTFSGFYYGSYIYGSSYSQDYWINGSHYVSNGDYSSTNNTVFNNNFVGIGYSPYVLYVQNNCPTTCTSSWDNRPTYNEYGTTTSLTSNSGNLFNLAAPDGGNYYSNYDEVAEGCSDTNSDGFCDAAYIPLNAVANGSSAVDNLPWTTPGGWLNQAPTANAGADVAGDEGAIIPLDGSASDDPNGDSLTYAWSVDNNTLCSFSDTASATPTISCTDNGSFLVTLTVGDGNGGSASDSATVNVSNINPNIGAIAVTPDDTVAVNTSLHFNAPYSDQGSNDTHSAIIDWGDGNSCNTTSSSACSVDPNTHLVSGDHTYTLAGIYIVQINLTDDDGTNDMVNSGFVVVWDPNAGYLTGNGSIQYAGNTDIFAIMSRYTGNALAGKVQHRFKVDGLLQDFISLSQEWLVIDNEQAIFQGGQGKINGAGNYNFFVSVIDGKYTGDPAQTDYFRIRITNAANNTLVYDNEPTLDPYAPAVTPVVAPNSKIYIRHEGQSAGFVGETEADNLQVFGNPPAELLEALKVPSQLPDGDNKLFLPITAQ